MFTIETPYLERIGHRTPNNRDEKTLSVSLGAP